MDRHVPFVVHIHQNDAVKAKDGEIEDEVDEIERTDGAVGEDRAETHQGTDVIELPILVRGMRLAEGCGDPHGGEDKQDENSPERHSESEARGDQRANERTADVSATAGGVDVGEEAATILGAGEVGYCALGNGDVGLAETADQAGDGKHYELPLVNGPGDKDVAEYGENKRAEENRLAAESIGDCAENGRAEELSQWVNGEQYADHHAATRDRRGCRQEAVVVHKKRDKEGDHHGIANEGHKDNQIERQERSNVLCGGIPVTGMVVHPRTQVQRVPLRSGLVRLRRRLVLLTGLGVGATVLLIRVVFFVDRILAIRALHFHHDFFGVCRDLVVVAEGLKPAGDQPEAAPYRQ